MAQPYTFAAPLPGNGMFASSVATPNCHRQAHVWRSRPTAPHQCYIREEIGLTLKRLSHADCGPNLFKHHSSTPHYIGMLS